MSKCKREFLKEYDDTKRENVNDRVYTSDKIAKWIVSTFNPSGLILEPCKGKGAFIKYIPNAEWCEIEDGKDFLKYNKKVDWIITNPPYSIFDKFLKHSFELADNIVFLCPLSKMLKAYKNIEMIKNFGGIKKLMFVRADKCGFPFGFPCGVFHIERNYKGCIEVDYF